MSKGIGIIFGYEHNQSNLNSLGKIDILRRKKTILALELSKQAKNESYKLNIMCKSSKVSFWLSYFKIFI